MRWEAWAERELQALDASDRRRTLTDLDLDGPRGRVAASGQPIVAFASNDYLGLTKHPHVIDAAQRALERWGAGAGAARLVTGSRDVHSRLETALADWKQCDRALLFSSGYAANVAVLSTFGSDPSTVICSDRLNHASIVDGCRLARARTHVYAHLDLDGLHRVLKSAARAIVVSDSVFSMDGDRAPVDELAALCARHDALLVLDEAHAVLGPHPDLRGVQHLRLGTSSKTLGSVGGFVAGSAPLVDLLVNRARPFVFSTATAPADAAAALAALEILRSEEGWSLIETLRSHVDCLRPAHPSPIFSVVLGSDTAAVAASRRLLDEGLFVPAIRPPSVPEGTARLRVTLSAAHSRDDVERLRRALVALSPAPARG